MFEAEKRTFCFLSISSMRWRLAALEGVLAFLLVSVFAMLTNDSSGGVPAVSWSKKLTAEKERGRREGFIRVEFRGGMNEVNAPSTPPTS